MAVSIFLAQALGLYLLIMSVSMLANHRVFQLIFQQWSQQPTLIILTSFIAIILGIILVLMHNIWVADWRIVITLLAWLTLIKGIVRLNFPQAAPKSMLYFQNHAGFYFGVGIFTLLVAIFLLYFGFVG